MTVQGSGATVQVEGLKELQRNLKRAESGLTTDVKAINREAAELVAEEVRRRAPVGGKGDQHPGRLRSTVRAGASLTTGVVRIGNGSTPYNKPVTFGWPAHNIKPNPFPYVGLDVRRAEVIALYERRIPVIVEKAFLE